MQENRLLKIYVLASIIGIIFLLFITENGQTTKTRIVEKISYSENKISILLENESIPFVVFENKLLDLKKGDKITLQGKLENYRGQEQFIINKITKVLPKPMLNILD